LKTINIVVFVIAGLVIAASAFLFFQNKESIESNTPPNQTNAQFINQEKKGCGDGICGIDEGCNDCPQDCGCAKGETCSQTNGVCYGKEVCGDGICTTLEKSSNLCCSDCACAGGEVCNTYLESCQRVFEISDGQLSAVKQKYPYYNLTSIQNGYYYDLPAKILSFDCTRESFAPCGVAVTLLENGSIVTEDRVIFTTN